mgnify:CR=1 FL=1
MRYYRKQGSTWDTIENKVRHEILEKTRLDMRYYRKQSYTWDTRENKVNMRYYRKQG